MCSQMHPHEDWHLQCSLFSVLFVGGCPLWEGSAPGLLWDPLPRVALLDAVVPLQEAICCRSSVDTVTMHSSDGSEAAAAHELCMREPTPCRDFMTGVWAVEWMVDEGIWQRMLMRHRGRGAPRWVYCNRGLSNKQGLRVPKTWLTVCVGVSSSGQSPDLVCLRLEASQWCPLVAKAMRALCTVVCVARAIRVTLLRAFPYSE